MPYIRELFQVREVLEGMAANLAANSISSETLDRIEEMFKSADSESIPELKFKAAETAGWMLHQEIIKSSKNQRIGNTLRHYQIILAKERNLVAQIEKRLNNVIEEHKAILKALRVGS